MLLPAMLMAQSASPITLDGNRLVLQDPIKFSPPTATRFRPGQARQLDPLVTWLAEKSYITTVRIEGHSTVPSNAQTISEAQAMTVARALVSKGVDCTRLIVVGFGSSKPVAASGDPANNRIEFVNAALRGRPIGGLPLDGGGNVAGDPCKR